MKGRGLALVVLVAIGLVLSMPAAAVADSGTKCKDASGRSPSLVSHQRGPCGRPRQRQCRRIDDKSLRRDCKQQRRGGNHRRCGRIDDRGRRDRCKARRGKNCRSIEDRGRRKECKRNDDRDRDRGRKRIGFYDGMKEKETNPETRSERNSRNN